MTPKDAIRSMVRHYPGGVAALAVVIGKPSAETLRKEVDGAQGYKLDANDAWAISEACIAVQAEGCYAYRHAVSPPEVGGESEPAKMDDRIAKAMKEISDLVGEVMTSRADGSYSSNDLKRIRKEAIEAVDAVLQIERTASAEAGRNLRAVG